MSDEKELKEEVALNEDNESGKRKKRPKSKARIIFEWVFTGIFAVIFVFVAIGQIGAMINKKENYNQNLPFGYGTFVVRTDSMEPKYKVKSAIITHKEKPQKVFEMFNKDNISTLASDADGVKVYTALWKSSDDDKTYGYLDITFMDVNGTAFAPYSSEYTIQTNPTGYPMTHRIREIHVKENATNENDKYVFVVAGINNESEHQSAKGQYQAFTGRQILGVVLIGSNFLGGFFGFLTTPWGLLIFLLIPAFYLVITSVLDIFKTMKEPDVEVETETETKEENKVDSLDGLSKEDRERLKQEMLEEMMNKKGK